MSTKVKNPTPVGSTGPNAAPTEHRTNPEVDAKIDAYIKENPKYWEYLQTTPKDRLQRMLVLKEVQVLDRQQRIKDSLMKEIEKKPDLKQAYDLLLKNVPEDLRDGVMVRMAQQARRAVARGQRASEGVAV
jgi:hypothetical protein